VCESDLCNQTMSCNNVLDNFYDFGTCKYLHATLMDIHIHVVILQFSFCSFHLFLLHAILCGDNCCDVWVYCLSYALSRILFDTTVHHSNFCVLCDSFTLSLNVVHN
jgi:hypothetical protein